MKTRTITLLALAGVLALCAASPALAATADAQDVGRNLGTLLKDWAGWLFGGVTAIVAIPYVARRDIAGGMVFVLVAVIVGGFVLAGPTVASIIESIYKVAAGA